MKCDLRSCSHGVLEPQMARVEVKGFELSASEIKSMKVEWKEDGEAMFHVECWRLLYNAIEKKETLTLGEREMAMVNEANSTAEYFDSLETMKTEAKRMAKLLKLAKYPIAFTGAGISTSAGIGDFRGRSGKWSEQAREKAHGPIKHKTKQRVPVRNLRPTYTHEALCKLLEMGHIKYVISQNTDGLHRLSGIPRDRISELHGNSFHEKCEVCLARYERPFPMMRGEKKKAPPNPCKKCRINHRTGRKCEREGCKGYLMNTIINFGDWLEGDILSKAEKEAEKNDFCLCLGTTLRVNPACDLVTMGATPMTLAIVNRQPTPQDRLSGKTVGGQKRGGKIHYDCDPFMKEIMKEILPLEELQEWEEDREKRMEEYDKMRV